MIYPCPTHGPERRDERFRELDARIAAEEATQRQRAASRAPVPRSASRDRIEAHAAAMRERNAWVLSLRERVRREWAEKKELW